MLLSMEKWTLQMGLRIRSLDGEVHLDGLVGPVKSLESLKVKPFLVELERDVMTEEWGWRDGSMKIPNSVAVFKM